jgi:hypothetical protein
MDFATANFKWLQRLVRKIAEFVLSKSLQLARMATVCQFPRWPGKIKIDPNAATRFDWFFAVDN